MSDRNPNHPLNSDASLGEALRALPLMAPADGAWQKLAATLKTQMSSAPLAQRTPSHHWRYILPAALAAGLLLFLLVPKMTMDSVPPVTRSAENSDRPQTQTSSDAVQELATLHARSQSLEQWLRDTRSAAASLNSQDLLASTEIEDLIGLVDVQLQAPAAGDARPLWRQRVRLLQDLAALRYSQYSLAGTRVANDGTSATHAIWIN